MSVLLAAPCAIYLALTSDVSTMYTAGLIVVASLWIASGARAYWLIRRRRIAEHREWVIRNYVITFFFITFFFIFDVTQALGIGTFEGVASVGAWACWLIPLAVAEFVLRNRRAAR